MYGAIVPVTGRHPGARLVSLRDRLDDLFYQHVRGQPTEVWFEAPIPPGSGMGLHPTIASWSCDVIVKMATEPYGIEPIAQHMGQTRAHVLGTARVDITREQKQMLPKDAQRKLRRAANKSAVIEWCHSVGLEDVVDDNIADSIVLAEYAANCHDFNVVP